MSKTKSEPRVAAPSAPAAAEPDSAADSASLPAGPADDAPTARHAAPPLAEGDLVTYHLAAGDPGYYPGATAEAEVLRLHRNMDVPSHEASSADLEVSAPGREKFLVPGALLAGAGRCPKGTPRSFSR